MKKTKPTTKQPARSPRPVKPQPQRAAQPASDTKLGSDMLAMLAILAGVSAKAAIHESIAHDLEPNAVLDLVGAPDNAGRILNAARKAQKAAVDAGKPESEVKHATITACAMETCEIIHEHFHLNHAAASAVGA